MSENGKVFVTNIPILSTVQVAIDFGISNTDVVAYIDGELHCWTQPYDGQPNPELVRTILAHGPVELSSLRQLAVTGGRHRLLPPKIGNCTLISVGELQAIGRGGQAMAETCGHDRAQPLLVVSAGSGTAVLAARGHEYTHVTGTAVGGGTLLGLGRLLLQSTDPRSIDELARRGDANGVDLSLADVVTGPIGTLPADATAVSFGRLARDNTAAGRADLAAALVNMVGQVIGLLAVNAARAQQIDHIVVTGHLTDMSSIRRILRLVGEYYRTPLDLPKGAGYATALGALLYGGGSI
jgi:type II pantothenate kinase